jgi:dynein heavy chain
MSKTMNMIFEPMDLLEASPATVSRCGMIFMEPFLLGWQPIYDSWKLGLPANFIAYDHEHFDLYFSNILAPLLNQFEAGKFTLTAPVPNQNMVQTLLRIATKFMNKFEDKVFYNSFEPKERVHLMHQICVYATTWSCGACVEGEDRRNFDSTLKRFINSADASVPTQKARTHPKIKLPDSLMIYDFFLDIQEEETGDEEKRKITVDWQKWTNLIDENEMPPAEMYVTEIVVKTADTIRYSHLIREYLKAENHMMICGPTGTGKTIYIKRILNELDANTYFRVELGFSAQTTAKHTQEILDGQMTRRSTKGIYGPPIGKKMIMFVDD